MCSCISYVFWTLVSAAIIGIVVASTESVPYSKVRPGYLSISLSYHGKTDSIRWARCFGFTGLPGKIAGCAMKGSGWVGAKLTSVE